MDRRQVVRLDIKALVNDPVQRREMIVRCIMTIQSREGIETTREQAEAAYDRVYGENHDG